MNYQHHSRLIKWTVASLALVIPIACSSTSGTGQLTGPQDSGATSQQGKDSGTNTSTQPTDSGNTTTQPTDSGVITDSSVTGDTNPTPPPGDGNVPMGFPGTYTCNLSGMANVSIGGGAPTAYNLPFDGTMMVTETGTAIVAAIMGEGGMDCTLDFTDKGNMVADVNANQTCMITAMGVAATLTFVSMAGDDAGPPGTATLSGTTITAALPFHLSAAGGIATGTGTLTGPCVK